LGSPSRQSRFNEHSNARFFDTDAGLIRYSGKKDDRTATSSSAGSRFGVLVFSVMLSNLLVITSTDIVVPVPNQKRDKRRHRVLPYVIYKRRGLPSPLRPTETTVHHNQPPSPYPPSLSPPPRVRPFHIRGAPIQRATFPSCLHNAQYNHRYYAYSHTSVAVRV